MKTSGPLPTAGDGRHACLHYYTQESLRDATISCAGPRDIVTLASVGMSADAAGTSARATWLCGEGALCHVGQRCRLVFERAKPSRTQRTARLEVPWHRHE